MFDPVAAVADQVLDVLLLRRHLLDVLGQRDELARLASFSDSNSSRSASFSRLAKSRPTPSLSIDAQFLVERDVLVESVFFMRLQVVEDVAHDVFLDLVQKRVLLERFARDVQRQVARIDHAADEAQVRRQQFLAAIHDEDALDVEPQPASAPPSATPSAGAAGMNMQDAELGLRPPPCNG